MSKSLFLNSHLSHKILTDRLLLLGAQKDRTQFKGHKKYSFNCQKKGRGRIPAWSGCKVWSIYIFIIKKYTMLFYKCIKRGCNRPKII